MFLRSSLPKIALALLGLFLFVSISEAAECNPCATNAEAACPRGVERLRNESSQVTPDGWTQRSKKQGFESRLWYHVGYKGISGYCSVPFS